MSLAELSEQEIIRRNSLNELKNLGINAYPAPEFKVTHLSKEIRDKFENGIIHRASFIPTHIIPTHVDLNPTFGIL